MTGIHNAEVPATSNLEDSYDISYFCVTRAIHPDMKKRVTLKRTHAVVETLQHLVRIGREIQRLLLRRSSWRLRLPKGSLLTKVEELSD